VSALLLIVGLINNFSSARALLEKRYSGVKGGRSVELGCSEQNDEEADEEDTDDTKVLKSPISESKCRKIYHEPTLQRLL
jgi:hypothetical protein